MVAGWNTDSPLPYSAAFEPVCTCSLYQRIALPLRLFFTMLRMQSEVGAVKLRPRPRGRIVSLQISQTPKSEATFSAYRHLTSPLGLCRYAALPSSAQFGIPRSRLLPTCKLTIVRDRLLGLRQSSSARQVVGLRFMHGYGLSQRYFIGHGSCLGVGLHLGTLEHNIRRSTD